MKTKTFRCAWCFEINEILVDISEGMDQVFVEDCQVCCRPNTIHVTIDDESLEITVSAEAEG
ncbi:MAG: CPXCG motif-containing cysteine-rich protein [Ignavibacteriae bacterium]|nr:CPXCG motif-containing cysteine-rich protein [Ignavibacteriota bacterium]